MARGMGAFNAGASAISNNAAAFRADVDEIKGANRALVQQTYAANDLKHLYDIGAEGAIRALKPQLEKGLGYAYEKTGLKAWDQKTTDAIHKWRRKMGLEADPESNEVDGNPAGSREAPTSEVEGTTGGEIEMADINPSEAVGSEQELQDMVQVGGRQGATTGIESEAAERYGAEGLGGRMEPVDTEQIANQRGMRMEDVDAPEEPGQVRRGRMTDTDRGVQGEPSDPEGRVGTDGAAPEDMDAGDIGGDALAGAGEDVAAGAGEEAVTQGVAGGLEAFGAAADATGVGALVGVPAQILGGLVELFGGYEAARGIGEWFNEDILGHHPKVPQMKLPTPPKVDNANLAIPSFDSVQDAPSTSSSW